MDFIFYYLLRRFFISLSFDNESIHLEKGLILRRVSDIPYSSAALYEIRRSPLLRLLGGSHVTIVTHSGKVSFYLRRGEKLPFLPKHTRAAIRPSRLQIIYGAFEDTRAFGGTFTFAAAISRVGNILGKEYSGKITAALESAADSLSGTLSSVNIAVPRIAAVIAVFLMTAWLFAFVKKAVMLSRFSLSAQNGVITAKHGFITLYERTLVLNNINAVISRKAVTGTLSGTAAVYCMGRMFFPPIKDSKREQLLNSVFHLPLPRHANRAKYANIHTNYANISAKKPPPKAVFAYCAAPFWWFIGSAALLAAVYFGESRRVIQPLPLMRSVLWFMAAIGLYNVFARALYMKRCAVKAGGEIYEITCIKQSRLYAAEIPSQKVVWKKTRFTPFSLKSGLCDQYFGVYGEGSFRLRQVPFL